MRIAVSSCLLGDPCRYDGKSVADENVVALSLSHQLVPICPECLGGLPTPRPRAEIIDGVQSASLCKVVKTEQGTDVTTAYVEGARESLRIFKKEQCVCAILKSRSPSCGVHEVHDGQFGEGMVTGQGVAAAMFLEAGIPVYDENDFMDGLKTYDERTDGK